MDKAAIYPHSVDYARENGELDAWRENRKINTACTQAIDKAISDSNYELYHYDLKTAANTVVEQFGFDRVNFVLAGVLQTFDYDGRYSHTNKEWGRSLGVAGDEKLYCKSHATLIDGFINYVRKSHTHMMVQAVGKYEKSRRVAGHKCLAYFNNDTGEYVLQKDVPHRQLMERHTEISQKQAAQRAKKPSLADRLEAGKRKVQPPAAKDARQKTGPNID